MHVSNTAREEHYSLTDTDSPARLHAPMARLYMTELTPTKGSRRALSITATAFCAWGKAAFAIWMVDVQKRQETPK